MKKVYFLAVPFDKKLVTLALESGVDAIITEADQVKAVAALSRTQVISTGEVTCVAIVDKSAEALAIESLLAGKITYLTRPYEIIPVENILAASTGLGLEVGNVDEAELAAGILERGADFLVVPSNAAMELKAIVKAVKLSGKKVQLDEAVITEVAPAGMGHRVCVDTISVLKKGQGMLIGNSSAFTFLVHAETESNPYVAARPFRINAGAVHAYALMPGDKTRYLEEIKSGAEVLIVDANGATMPATVGRAKVEIRPMLRITAKVGDTVGAVFLQNAETIRLTRPGGEPVSVVELKPGDKVLTKLDEAGRHFGMRVAETIAEE